MSNTSNLQILCLLRNQPSNPLRLAKLLGIRISHISERLRNLERAGLVKSRWGRAGEKNVKLYSLNAESLEFEFGRLGPSLKFHKKGGGVGVPSGDVFARRFFRSEIPNPDVFVGRVEELARLRSAKGPVVLWGLPGIGKTSLAAEYAHSVASARPVFWHDIREVDSFDHVILKLAVFLSGLGRGALLELVDSETRDDRLKLEAARSELDEARALVVFDDYHYCSDPRVKALLREILGRKSKARAIVISRTLPDDVMPSPRPDVMKLDGLGREDAGALLAKEMFSGPESLPRLKGRTNPLTIRLLGGVAYGARSPRSGQQLARYVTPSGLDGSYVYSQLAGTLSEEELSVVNSLSIFREPVPNEALRSVSRSGGGLPRTLHQLERKGVLLRTDGRLLLHDAVREECYARLEYPRVLHKRAADYYLPLLDSQSILEGMHHLAKAGDLERLAEVLSRVGLGLTEEGLSDFCLRILDEAREDEQSAKVSPRARAWLDLGRAQAMIGLGNLEDAMALAHSSLSEATKSRDYDLAVHCRLNLSRGYVQTLDMTGAEEELKEGLTLAKSGRLSAELRAALLYRLSGFYTSRGKLSEAAAILRELVALYGARGETDRYLSTRNTTCLIEYLQGDVSSAISGLKVLRMEATKRGRRFTGAYSNLYLGMMHSDCGEFASAASRLTEAIALFEEFSAAPMLLICYAERATAKALGGRLEDARRDLTLAEDLRKKGESLTATGLLELALGLVETRRGKLDESRKHFDLSERAFTTDMSFLSRVLRLRGLAELKRGDRTEGARCLTRCVEVAAGHGITRYSELATRELQESAQHERWPSMSG